MIFISQELSSQAATSVPLPPALIATLPIDWTDRLILALPVFGAFLLGLVVGGVIFLRRCQAAAEARSAESAVDPPAIEAESDSKIADESEESVPEEEEGQEAVGPSLAEENEGLVKALALSEKRGELRIEEIQTMRFAAAARDGEIARLKAKVEKQKAALAELKAQAETEVRPLPESSPTNPIASRLGTETAPLISESELILPDDRRSGGTFIRRLLGLRQISPDRAQPDENGVALAPASLSEAQAALGELRQVVPVVAMARGEEGDASNADRPSGSLENDEELIELRRRLEKRNLQIAALEAELAELRQQAFRVETGAGGEDESSDLLVPGFLDSRDDEPEKGGGRISGGGKDDGEIEPFIGRGEDIPVTEQEVVLFRGTNPRLWNTNSSREESELARQVEDCPADIDFIRICRLDSGESVVCRITREELIRGGSAKASRGWSGRGEEYFGAFHLGFFDENLPRDVETKFGSGGWGFGHRESIGSGQACAWAGRVVEDPSAGFTISVGKLPEGVDIIESAIVSDLDGEKSKSGAESVTAEAVAAALAAKTRTRTVSSPNLETEEEAPKSISLSERSEEAAPPAVAQVPEPRRPEVVESSGPDLAALTRQADKRTSGLVLFRSNDPAIWNTDTFLGANRRARSLESLPEGLAFLRLRRVDTGEGVVIAITNESLLDDADGQPRGFNGTNERFYGAYHLGAFDESLPQDVETRFTFGGWGFGHSVMGAEEQASGWAGMRIPEDTVFEIAVFRRMPILGESDRMLD